MASFGRSCEKTAEAVANFVGGLNQRLDENHIVDMMISLKDEEISIDEFQEFTTIIKELRNGKSSIKTAKATTTTGA